MKFALAHNYNVKLIKISTDLIFPVMSFYRMLVFIPHNLHKWLPGTAKILNAILVVNQLKIFKHIGMVLNGKIVFG